MDSAIFEGPDVDEERDALNMTTYEAFVLCLYGHANGHTLRMCGLSPKAAVYSVMHGGLGIGDEG